MISSVATSVGIGGGVVFSSLLVYIQNMLPTQAYPISTFIIMITSICTFSMGVRHKSQNPSSSFVNYDLAIVFCPSLLLGTKFGTIFNKMLNPLVLIIILLGLVGRNVFNIYYKAQAAEKKEVMEIADLKNNLLRDNIAVVS